MSKMIYIHNCLDCPYCIEYHCSKDRDVKIWIAGTPDNCPNKRKK